MGLFDKKYCDICGEKIGFLGNRKLEDGNLCKDCARKLSPWFDERRHSTVEQIREQLEYRERNREAVANFHVSEEYGERTMVLVDGASRSFMVTDCRPERLQEANPDVISLDSVKDCSYDVSESRRELYRKDSEGNNVSYSPPRYVYSYRFQMKILVDNPYFDDINFQLNGSPVEIERGERSFFSSGHIGERDYEYRQYKEKAEEIVRVLTGKVDPEGSFRDEAGNDVKIVTCPYCGSKSRLDYSGRCEHCGGSLEG